MSDVKTLKIRDEFIKLGQALKLAGMVDSGIEAKVIIQDGQVKVDGVIDERRGRKMYNGMTFEYEGQKVMISSPFPNPLEER